MTDAFGVLSMKAVYEMLEEEDCHDVDNRLKN